MKSTQALENFWMMKLMDKIYNSIFTLAVRYIFLSTLHWCDLGENGEFISKTLKTTYGCSEDDLVSKIKV